MNAFISSRRFLIPSASLRPRRLVAPVQIVSDGPLSVTISARSRPGTAPLRSPHQAPQP